MRPSAAILEQLATLRLLPSHAVPSMGIGERRSASRGAGIEFAEHRPYRRGDDVRHIDPRVKARLGEGEELAAIERLDKQARLVEKTATGPSFHEYVAEEWRRSPEYGGRTVMDDVREKGLGWPKWAKTGA